MAFSITELAHRKEWSNSDTVMSITSVALSIHTLKQPQNIGHDGGL